MKNRFDSSFNKPSKLALTSKAKVMAEFRHFQDSLRTIAASDIDKEEDPYSSSHQKLMQTLDPKQTMSEQKWKTANGGPQFNTLDADFERTPQKGKRGGNVHNRANSIGNPMNLHLVAGGIIQAPELDRPMRYSKGGEYVPLDLKETYSSFELNQPVFRRSTGFVNFGVQLDRGNFPTNNCHEHRFQNINHMPRCLSNSKYTPQVQFQKQLDRNLDKVYGGIQMGESDFYYELLNKVKPTAKGIYHFPDSKVQRGSMGKTALNAQQDQIELDKWSLLKSQVKKDKKGGQQANKFQEQKKPGTKEEVEMDIPEITPAEFFVITENQELNKKNTRDELAGGFRKQRFVSIKKQMDREQTQFCVGNKRNQRINEKMIGTYPSHLHNATGRPIQNYQTVKSFVERNASQQQFFDPKSCLNESVDHHKTGPRFNAKAAAVKAGKTGKKQATFNQLLVQHKILENTNDKKPRDRPWLVKQQVAYESSDESDVQ